MQTRTALTEQIECPQCQTPIDGEPEEGNEAVTHYTCSCGYRLAMRRDSMGGIINAWRE